MNVTNFDERNIKYFAGRYCCNQAPFADLVQEGWLAALTAREPEHKYLRIKLAIQEYKRKATVITPTSYIQEKSEESSELRMIESLEHLEKLLEVTDLTEKELECIKLVYFGEELTFENAGSVCGVSKQAMHIRHDNAMRKLRDSAEELL